MKRRFILLAFGLLISGIFFVIPDAPAQTNWSEWVRELRVEALSQGVQPELFDRVFGDIKGPNQHILNFERTQPEKRITFLQYRQTRADNFRIVLGRKEYNKNSSLLNEIGYKYGVSPCFIVSLWGLETSYGHFMGTFPVIESLATLAYGSRRAPFFRKELLYALQILDGGHVNMSDFKGEWAGASGHPQFLPSTWHDYAVDYDKCGHKDIWKALPDVFASISNYLAHLGWRANQPWALEVQLPDNLDQNLVNSNAEYSVSDWQRMGLRTVAERPWPKSSLRATLIQPLGGPNFLVFNNFKVLMKWNHSSYYAGTVGYMAEQICNRPIQ